MYNCFEHNMLLCFGRISPFTCPWLQNQSPSSNKTYLFISYLKKACSILFKMRTQFRFSNFFSFGNSCETRAIEINLKTTRIILKSYLVRTKYLRYVISIFKTKFVLLLITSNPQTCLVRIFMELVHNPTYLGNALCVVRLCVG